MLLDTSIQQMNDGDEINVIYLKTEGALKDEFEAAGVSITKIDCATHKILFSFIKLAYKIKKGNYDIVHTHLPFANFTGRFAAILAGCDNIVSTVHGIDKWLESTRILDRTIKKADIFLNNLKRSKVIAVSSAVKSHIRKNEPKTKEQKVTIVFNAINLERIGKHASQPISLAGLGIGADDFIVICIGRLEKEKGQIFLLKALNRLITEEKLKNIKCLIVGDGSERMVLEDYIKENHIEKNVYIMGIQENPCMYLKNSHLAVIPSISEAFSLAVLEAFYCGVPVLSTKAGGLKELVKNGETGILIESGKHNLLAEEVKKFYKKEYNVEYLTGNASSFVENLNIVQYTKKLRDVYCLK